MRAPGAASAFPSGAADMRPSRAVKMPAGEGAAASPGSPERAPSSRAQHPNQEPESGAEDGLPAPARLIGITSPSRLKIQPQPTAANPGTPSGAAAQRPPASPSPSPSPSPPRAAMSSSFVASEPAGASEDATKGLLGDVVVPELSGGARAMVVCLFKRVHGGSDPGNTGASLLTRSEGDNLLSETHGLATLPLTYNLFARWAAPLNSKLRRIREKVQAEFLAQATIGGGAKDFPRAFRRIDRNGDGMMSVAEFRVALGPLVRSLDPHEMQALCDYFDADGSRVIDFGEFLGIMSSGSAIARQVAEELDGDDDYTLPPDA
jgi:hypothetical protein